jgi:PTS system nitrogen regulatory IIA component
MTLTVRDAATLLRVSEKTIYRWISQRTVPAYMMNGQYRFYRVELLEWATSRQHWSVAESFTESRATTVNQRCGAL